MTSLRRVMLLDELSSALAEEVSTGLAALGHPELRPARWFVLATIADAEPSAALLARWLRMTRQSASELLGYAIRHGYAERLPERGNRRSIPVKLTGKGQLVVQAAERLAGDAILRWSGGCRAEPPDRAFDVIDRMAAFHRWRQSRWVG